MDKTRSCAFQANYHLIWATKYRRKVLVGSGEVRLLEVLKMIAENHGYVLLTACVYDGDHGMCLCLLSRKCVFLLLFVF